MSLPIIDISSPDVAQQFYEAFSTVGFAFITGHGIPRELVS